MAACRATAAVSPLNSVQHQRIHSGARPRLSRHLNREFILNTCIIIVLTQVSGADPDVHCLSENEEPFRRCTRFHPPLETHAKFQCWGGQRALWACSPREQGCKDRMHHHDTPRDGTDLGGASGSYLDI